MYKTSLGSVTKEIEDLLVEKFSAKGRNLNEKIRSVRRQIPRRIREHAAYLAEAESRWRNPKRAHQYDAKKVLEARKQCVRHLEKIDRAQIRARKRLAWFTGALINVFILLLLFAYMAHKLTMASGAAGY